MPASQKSAPHVLRRGPQTQGHSPAQLAAMAREQERAKVRTPSPVLAAFFPEPIEVGKLPLRPFSLGDFILLEKLGSPLLEIEDADAAEEVQISVEEYAAAVFVLSAPFDQVAALVSRGPAGRPEFDAAVLAFAAQIPAIELVPIGLKVRAAIAAGFATVQGMGSEKKTTAPTPGSAGR